LSIPDLAGDELERGLLSQGITNNLFCSCQSRFKIDGNIGFTN
jgi:hypothetical protein